MANINKSERVPKPMETTFNTIVALTDAFCRAHLDSAGRSPCHVGGLRLDPHS
jgi:hypothetical protein